MIIEINPTVPPPVKFAVLYTPEMPMIENPFYGCSLSYISELVKPYGYVLLQLRWWDAYYVRAEYVEAFGSVPHKDEDVYKFGYYGTPELSFFKSNVKAYHTIVEDVQQAKENWKKALIVANLMATLNTEQHFPFQVDY